MMDARFAFLILLPLLACTKIDLQPNRINTFKIESDTITFAIIGDYGEAGDPALKVSELVKSWSPDFILTLGDNNYANGKLATIKENISAYYCDYIYNPDAPAGFRCDGRAARERQNRFFPSLGNHDYYNSRQIEPYLTFFSLPNKETYYEFQWGPVHFFTINSGRDGEAVCCGSEQAVWLKEKLERSARPFRIVYFHHPPYSTGGHGSSPSLRWPFEDWGASAVFSAHDHNYQRINRKNTPNFPYFVNGLGGRQNISDCGLHPLDTNEFDSFCYKGTYGAIRARATISRLVLQFFSIDDPDTPVDQFVLGR